MSHWITLPVVLPALVAAVIILLARYHVQIQRVLSVASSVALVVICAGLAWRASDGTVDVYTLGNWAAPFGIVLVADRLSTYMTLLLALLTLPVVLYAIGARWDERGRHLHALFQLQVMGVMGAFLTGDAFNLFVFFEILLIASYGLMVHAGGRARLRAGTQYVLYNLLGSTLFLFALGTIYAETGTLNMADLAGRIAAIPPGEDAGIRVAAVLLLMVFALKGAIAPLQFWLPGSYANAPGPVAAFFAIMTKVGAYAIIRAYTLFFPPYLDVTQGLHTVWLMPVALASIVIGMVGVLGAKRLDRLVAFSVVGSMGMVASAIAVFTETGIAAALYYIAHSTFATGLLFLTVDLVKRGLRHDDLSLNPRGPIPSEAAVAGLFFAGAIAMAGLPPLSGFIGKLLVLDASYASPLVWWVWAVVLGSSLVAVIGFSRAGSAVFWKSHELTGEAADHAAPATDPDDRPTRLELVSVGLLLAALVAITAAAGPMLRYMETTAAALMNPAPYIEAVMSSTGKDLSGGYDDTDPDTEEAE
ncbi:monovalent cation/H+ antiporter subunit D [Palleronia sediminis]|uniref:Monovalent cation/H+ antiporter subunit D n=1 Tax=Palleronia sediminis TaxID=2547833 RepID=A0A4R6AIE1_9RHOB|nr:monovalent cation/H+ antiporter subunit D [Palleronia sediminis]TDL81133.1 monovalent cation/H+ antiporter subunit D [Palleronia sediminis]